MNQILFTHIVSINFSGFGIWSLEKARNHRDNFENMIFNRRSKFYFQKHWHFFSLYLKGFSWISKYGGTRRMFSNRKFISPFLKTKNKKIWEKVLLLSKVFFLFSKEVVKYYWKVRTKHSFLRWFLWFYKWLTF